VSRTISAGLELGTILSKLPDCFRNCHKLVEIREAYAFGYANQLWTRTWAVRILFEANMESGESRGHGNRAARRERLLGLRDWQKKHGPPLEITS
jgi:hypothetical protein